MVHRNRKINEGKKFMLVIGRTGEVDGNQNP